MQVILEFRIGIPSFFNCTGNPKIPNKRFFSWSSQLSNFILFLQDQFWFTFIVNLCKQFFAIPERKILHQNGPYINTFQINLRNVCLSLIPEFCLSSVLCGRLPAYPSSFRGLEYSLKVTVYYSSSA